MNPIHKIIIALFICLHCTLTTHAQDSLSKGFICDPGAMPEFPGGSTAMHKFISDNMRYPQMEKDSNIQGKVVVGFMVDVNGSVTDVRLKKGISPGLDAEAIRIVSLMPPFIPAQRLGKNVSVPLVLPVLFKLNGK